LARQWSPFEVNMSDDRACFYQRLTEEEKFLYTNVFASLTTADLAVGNNVAELILPVIKCAELKQFLFRQIADEALHNLAYFHVLEVLGLDQEDVYSRYQRIPQISQLFDWARGKTHLDEVGFVEALIAWGMFIEGVWFQTGFAPIMSLRRRNLMTGTGTQLEWIFIDEVQHVAFNARMLNAIFQEDPALRPTESSVYRIFEEGIQATGIWADYCIPDILGYNRKLHMQHARCLADRRLRQLGYGALFNEPVALPWLDEISGGIRKEAAFFEIRPTAYQVGRGLWDEAEETDDPAGLDAVAAWRK
jgi:ribonucleoside-diphosphate reductase beta chain